MLSWFVGNVDVPAAAVLIAMCAGVAAIALGLIAKYQDRIAAAREFELAKMRISSEEKQRLFQSETDRIYKTKQLEQNLITSHRAE